MGHASLSWLCSLKSLILRRLRRRQARSVDLVLVGIPTSGYCNLDIIQKRGIIHGPDRLFE